MTANPRDELIDGLCEEGAYSAESAIYLADQYRAHVLAERALAVSWSEYDETVPPRDRIVADMRELTAIADPEHRARRGARTSLNLDAYRDQILTEEERRVADWIEQHDPAGELSWFIDTLRAGLAAHDADRCSLCPDEETT